MTEKELTAIEARATAATREPWSVSDTFVPSALLSAVSVYGMGMEVAECQMGADGAFIAAARVDVPALVAEVRKLRAECDALRKERDILAARLEAAIELEAEVSGANRRLVRERDVLRAVCEAAKQWLEMRHGPRDVLYGNAQRALVDAVTALVAAEERT